LLLLLLRLLQLNGFLAYILSWNCAILMFKRIKKMFCQKMRIKNCWKILVIINLNIYKIKIINIVSFHVKIVSHHLMDYSIVDCQLSLKFVKENSNRKYILFEFEYIFLHHWSE
jgi:hypothetical protein